MKKNKKIRVAVIGAGVGGLSCAAYLTRCGLAVDIYERLDNIGGVINSFRRGKYIFEASTHQMCGYGMKDFTQDVFKKLLNNGSITLCPSDSSYESFFQNGLGLERYKIPVFRKNILKYFEQEFNIENGYLKSIMDDITDLRKNISKISRIFQSRYPVRELHNILQIIILKNHKKNKLFGALSTLFFNKLKKYKNITASDFLNPLGNKVLESVLSQYWIYTSHSPDNLSALMLSQMIVSFMFNPPFMIKGGTANLLMGMKKTIIDNGGRIFLNCKVGKINIKKDTVKSIVLENGRLVNYDYIFSNTGINELFFNMIKRKDLPGDYLNGIKQLDSTHSMFQVYCGLNADLKTYGLKASTNFFNFSHDHNENFRYSLKGPHAKSPMILTNYSLHDDTFSPKGCSSIVLFEFDDIRRWTGLNRKEYLNKKENIQTLMLKKAEKLTGLPFTEKSEILFSATPITFRHYSNKKHAGMIGSKERFLPGNTKKIEYTTPIKNLFLTGDIINSGVIPAMRSGIASANILLRRI